jgi:ssDNA-binding replication factor A large subunit
MGPSSSASRDEAAEDEDEDDEDREDDARAQVTDGEPPAPPCRITSLVGRCGGGGAEDVEDDDGGPWPGGR